MLKPEHNSADNPPPKPADADRFLAEFCKAKQYYTWLSIWGDKKEQWWGMSSHDITAAAIAIAKHNAGLK